MSQQRIVLPIVLTSLLSAMLVAVVLFVFYGRGDQATPPISAEKAEAILAELKQINATLARMEKQGGEARRPTQVTTASVSTQNRPVRGREDAPVTIVEYSDYQCPFCKRFVDNTLAELQKAYIDTGKVRLVFKDMPLDFHNHARKAAQAAHCAGEQDKYWPMHDVLFGNIKKLEDERIVEYAGLIGLKREQFTACFASERYLAQIDADIAEAKKARITGTPTFVIGKTTKDVITGDVIRGAQPLKSLKILIEKHLAQ